MILEVIALLSMGFLAAFGAYFLKRSTANGLYPLILLRSPQLYIGGILYVCSALLNLYLLKLLPYSLVLPLGALTYVWTLGISHFLLGETVSPRKLAGIGLILAGVVLVALSA